MALKLDSFINDFSGIIDSETIKQYNKKFFDYKQKSWVEIATVFIKHRNWRELKDIALEIFNENGIWWAETNSWLLLIVVTGEKKIRIMTGKWMEVEFPDSYCKDMIDLELRGLMNSEKYDELIKSWLELSSKDRAIIKPVIQYYDSWISFTNKNIWVFILWIGFLLGSLYLGVWQSQPWIIWVGVLGFILSFFLTSYLSKRMKLIDFIWTSLAFIIILTLVISFMYKNKDYLYISSSKISSNSYNSSKSISTSNSKSRRSSSSSSSSSRSSSSSSYWWWSSNGWGAGD